MDGWAAVGGGGGGGRVGGWGGGVTAPCRWEVNRVVCCGSVAEASPLRCHGDRPYFFFLLPNFFFFLRRSSPASYWWRMSTSFCLLVFFSTFFFLRGPSRPRALTSASLMGSHLVELALVTPHYTTNDGKKKPEGWPFIFRPSN